MTTTPTHQLMLNVRSGVTPTGEYCVELDVHADYAWMVTADQALAHAAAFVAAATIAEHEWALLTLLHQRDVGAPAAAGLFREHIRPARPLHPQDTAPLVLEPIVSNAGPSVHTEHDGKPLGSMHPAACRDHAANVLAVLTATQLDNHLHHVLTTVVHLDDGPARALIHDMGNFWPRSTR